MKIGTALLGISLLAATISCSRIIETATSEQSAQENLVTDSSKTTSADLNDYDFSGVTVTVVGLTYPIGNAFESHKAAFEKATGATIVFETVPFGDLYKTIETDYRTSENRYDMVIYPPIWLSDMVKANYLADLKPKVEADTALKWNDITPFFQEHGGTYGDK
ncbi:MAG: extracellular solute-binding protein, partial [Cyanobacteria bacterium J06650_10]